MKDTLMIALIAVCLVLVSVIVIERIELKSNTFSNRASIINYLCDFRKGIEYL